MENITGGSSQDLILMSTQEDGSVQIELLTADRKGQLPAGGGQRPFRR